MRIHILGHLVAVIETIDEQLKEIEWYEITLRGENTFLLLHLN